MSIVKKFGHEPIFLLAALFSMIVRDIEFILSAKLKYRYIRSYSYREVKG